MAIVKERTATLGLAIINFDERGYHDEANNNMRIIDANLTLGSIVDAVKSWTNSTAYTASTRVADPVNGSVWECLVDHNSAAAPTTFAADRAANPTYWVVLNAGVVVRGEWAASTFYSKGDAAYSTADQMVGIAASDHTSTTSMRDDIANWSLMADYKASTDAIIAAATAQADAAADSASDANDDALAAAASAGNAANSASNAAISASEAALSGNITSNIDVKGFEIHNGTLRDFNVLRRGYATWDGTTLVANDCGKYYTIDMTTYNTPALPAPASLPTGWHVTFQMDGAQAAIDEFNVTITGRVAEVFVGYSYPFYTFGRGEIVRFINDGTNYRVEVLGNCIVDEDDLMSTCSFTSALASSGVTVKFSQDTTTDNTTELPVELSNAIWKIRVPGIYSVYGAMQVYNHGGVGASGSAFGALYVGDNSASWPETTRSAYGLLNASVPVVTNDWTGQRDRDEYVGFWFNIPNTGRAFNQRCRIQWKGRW